MTTLQPKQITAALQQAGVQPGDWLFIHSSYKCFGKPVEGGPEAVIDAILQAVSPGGTILAPTHGAPPKDGPFQPDKGEMYPGMGIIPKLMTQRPDSRRSYHPTHSDTAIGPDAESLLQGHETAGALGPESPLGKLRRSPRGKVLLLGARFNALTLIHVAEAEVNLPYIGKAYGGQFPTRTTVEKNGAVIEVSIEDMPGHSSHFANAEPLCEQAGLISESTLGAARIRLLPAGKTVDVLADALRKNPRLLLGPPDESDFYKNAHRILDEKGL